MYFMFMLFLILGSIFACIACLILILAFFAWNVINKYKDEIKQQSSEVIIDMLESYSKIMAILFKIFPFLKKRLKNTAGNNIVSKLKQTCIKMIIGSLVLGLISITLISTSMSFYDMYVIQTSVPSLVSDLLAKEDPTKEELEEEGWKWDSTDDSFTYNSNNNSNSGSGTSTQLGNASGEFAVQLDDGSYYWYHQGGSSSDGCVFCGDWTTAQWGGSSDKHAFGTDGCAVYSLAIIASNLCGYPITPMDLLEDCFGCTVTDQGGLKIVDTSSSSIFEGRAIYKDLASVAIANKYGLNTSTKQTTGTSNDELKTYIDNVLSSGGLVWGYWVDDECTWCSNGTKHFMAIRKQVGNNYYCFTSCKGKCAKSSGKAGAVETMNYPLDKDECLNAMVDGAALYGFIPVNNGNSTSGGSTGGTINYSSSDVYNKLSQNSAYSNKAAAMAAAYESANAAYGEQFAIGLMANILAEGNYGQIEYKNSKTYWNNVPDSVLNIAGKVINNSNMVDTLLNDIPPGTPGIGVGSGQWSGGRRVNILELYKNKASTYTPDELGAIEVEYMMLEFSTSYSTVVDACNGKTASECASIICLNYEVPSNREVKAVERANAASDIESFLSN